MPLSLSEIWRKDTLVRRKSIYIHQDIVQIEAPGGLRAGAFNILYDANRRRKTYYFAYRMQGKAIALQQRTQAIKTFI